MHPPYLRHIQNTMAFSNEDLFIIADEEDSLGYYYYELLEAVDNGSLSIFNMRFDT